MKIGVVESAGWSCGIAGSETASARRVKSTAHDASASLPALAALKAPRMLASAPLELQLATSRPLCRSAQPSRHQSTPASHAHAQPCVAALLPTLSLPPTVRKDCETHRAARSRSKLHTRHVTGRRARYLTPPPRRFQPAELPRDVVAAAARRRAEARLSASASRLAPDPSRSRYVTQSCARASSIRVHIRVLSFDVQAGLRSGHS